MIDPDRSIEIKHRDIQVLKGEIDKYEQEKPRKILEKILEREKIIVEKSLQINIKIKIDRSITESTRLLKSFRDPKKFGESPWLDQVCFTLTTDDYHPEAEEVVHVDPDAEGEPVMDVDLHHDLRKRPRNSAPKKRLR